VSESPIKITISESGSYKVEGGPTLCDHDGNPLETREGKPFFLCRCGHSANKPFCDGTHKNVEWDPTLADRG
jgi:CDGSH-type Zn-finger protein